MNLPKTQVLIFKKFGYKIGRTIGKGTYSKVCLITDRRGSTLACRIIDKKYAGPEYIEKFLPRELDIVTSVKHPNIITVHRVLEADDSFYMVMEYCEKGDLLEYIRARGALPEDAAKALFRQVASAVAYLHARGVVHRDVKCENVLLGADGGAKLADFGFARRLRLRGPRTSLCDTFCGSAAYAAPEILRGEPYDGRAYDAWALGCVLYVAAAAEMPFDDRDARLMLRAQQRGAPLRAPAARRWTAPLRRLVGGLLEPDAARRLRVDEAARHDWLAPAPAPAPAPAKAATGDVEERRRGAAAAGATAAPAPAGDATRSCWCMCPKTGETTRSPSANANDQQ